MSFLPDGYEIPDAGSGYFKLKQGENRFRVVGSAITGWEYWVTEDGKRKPIRKRVNEDINVEEIEDAPKHFWAFPAYNYELKKVQILELTQKSIQKAIKALTRSGDWGDPKGYDIVILREGEGLETEYQVQPKPPKKLDGEVASVVKKSVESINLEALYDGDDPFAKTSEAITEKDMDDFADF